MRKRISNRNTIEYYYCKVVNSAFPKGYKLAYKMVSTRNIPVNQIDY